MARFEKVNFHVGLAGGAPPEATDRPARRTRGVAADTKRPAAFSSDVDAARYYVDQIMAGDQRAPLRSLRAPKRPERVPDLEHVRTQDMPATRTRLVRFQQQARELPIFGAQTVVELNERRQLVAVNGAVADVGNLSRVESVDRREALGDIIKLTGQQVDPEAIPPAQLVYFNDEHELREELSWHLAWYFRNVPAVPPAARRPDGAPDPHGLPGSSLRSRHRRMNYLIDAHDGTVLRYFSAAPTFAGPTWCDGLDEDGESQRFYGVMNGQAFEMRDPRRNLVTYDLGYEVIADPQPLPGSPVSGPEASWAANARAAVSAHVNAARVSDFYKVPLQRDGIDDHGMDLISVVNCRDVDQTPYPEWANAVWWEKTMWYGQVLKPDGTVVSLSRELDIIAHELTHGVIETSSELLYADESGALNESYADIFGILIRNWYEAPDRADPATWDWRMGDGFAQDGGPIRDLSDPKSRDQPDQYDDFLHTTDDDGGVHTNSGIPNKAAHNVLTATDAQGARIFTVEDAALLLYLAMVRLRPNATFVDAADAIVESTATLYAGTPALRDANVAAVKKAYAAVGISAT